MVGLRGDLLKAMGEVTMQYWQVTRKEPEEEFFTQHTKRVRSDDLGWLRRFRP